MIVRCICYGLVFLGALMVLFSIPIAWNILELANQEYFHGWPVRQISYDFEINGQPVTVNRFIQSQLFALASIWFVAACLFVLAWLTKSRFSIPANR